MTLNENTSGSAPRGILVSDFDGTITRFDFYDLVCREFPEISGGYWQHYEKGEITHFEALRLIFAGIRAPRERIFDLIEEMQIDPALAQAVSRLDSIGWKVEVASAGCAWYIDRLLKSRKVDITVYANPGEYSPERGLEMKLPESCACFSADLGINKVAVVRQALQRTPEVAFAGDGRPDLAPALLVPAERRFARSWLAKKLTEIGEGFHPFERWSEVAETLWQQEQK